jgi:hypothetical protein
VRVGVRCCEVGVVERRSEEQSSRLEALPRSLPSGSQSCLICVDRTHFGQDRPGRLGRLVGPSGGICSVVTHGGEHDVGESPFQAAQGFPFRLAGSAFAFVVDAAFGVATNLGDGDCVEGPVELPIPARVEPVSDGATGGGGQRCGAVGCGERVPVGVAVDVDDFGDEPGGDQRSDAVQVGQGGVGGGDQFADLPFQFCCFGVDGDDAFEAPSAQCGADAGVVAQQVEGGPDPGAGGQDRDLLLVAGSQTAQFGVGPVDQAAAFTDQVLAVVEQGAQIRSRADGQPDWR